MFTKIFAVFFKTITLLVIAAVVAPVAYFGYRLTQPMDPPEFKGLSYIQFFQWRNATWQAQAAKFKPAFSNEYPADPNACIVPAIFTQTSFVVLDVPVILFQDYQKGWPRIADFPYDWYESFEALVLGEAESVSFPNVAFCDLPLSKLPTPAQFDAMLNQDAASVNASAPVPTLVPSVVKKKRP